MPISLFCSINFDTNGQGLYKYNLYVAQCRFLGTSNVLLLCALASVNWRISGAQSLKVMTKCIDSFMWSTCLNATVYSFLDVCRFVVKHPSLEVLQHLTCLYLFWTKSNTYNNVNIGRFLSPALHGIVQLQATLIHSTTLYSLWTSHSSILQKFWECVHRSFHMGHILIPGHTYRVSSMFAGSFVSISYILTSNWIGCSR